MENEAFVERPDDFEIEYVVRSSEYTINCLAVVTVESTAVRTNHEVFDGR